MVEAMRTDSSDGNTIHAFFAHRECVEEATKYDQPVEPWYPVTMDDDVLCDICMKALFEEPGDILNASEIRSRKTE